MRSLSGSLYWGEGFLIWLSSRQILFRLFLGMYVSAMRVLVCSTARSRACNLSLRMFG